MVAKRSAKDIL